MKRRKTLVAAKAAPAATVTKQVRLLGGPLNGQEVTIPRSAERYEIRGLTGLAWWTYQFAGLVDGHEVFAKIPTARKERRFIHAFIGQHGKHPRALHGPGDTAKHNSSRSTRLKQRKLARQARLRSLKRDA